MFFSTKETRKIHHLLYHTLSLPSLKSCFFGKHQFLTQNHFGGLVVELLQKEEEKFILQSVLKELM
jgi:hypothetical protein